MRVLLVNAPTPGYALQPYPPLQLGYLAAALRASGRHDVEILDLGIEEQTDTETTARMQGFDAVGLYFVTMNWREGLRLAALAKQLGLPTMAGGPHAGLVPEETLRHGSLDFAFVGEAEVSLVRLLDALESGAPPTEVPGVVVATADGPRRHPQRAPRPDLRTLPWPARDLIPMSRYREVSDDTSALASRGCPYPCSFCAIRVMSNASYRRRAAKDFVAEVRHVQRTYGFDRFTFFDDIFTIDRRYVLALCAEMKASGLDITWSCETRVDRLDPEILTAMRDTGCYRIFFGVESGNQRILDSISKRTRVQQIKDAVSLTRGAGIRTVMSVMVGTPDDDAETIRDSIRLTRELESDEVWFQPFAPFPGTAIIPRISDLLDDDWMDMYHRLDLRSPVMRTRHLSLEEVKSLYLEAVMSTGARGWVKPSQATHSVS
ncbi:B12-binding domain-containing radical SAM protein [Streptomyces cellostaticus]|nr:radical SAM protein [Streptomyces cellostaticus]